MTLKVAVVQAAAGAGTPPFNQDFTDGTAGFSSDVRAALFIGSRATANHASAGAAQFNIGLAARTGGNTQATASFRVNDGVSGGNQAGNFGSTSYAYSLANTSYGSDGECAVGSWLSNGVRMSWSDQSIGELITAILIGGDVEARVVSATFTNAAAPDTRTVSHGLSGAPEVIIAVCPGNYGSALSLGTWVTGGTYTSRATYSNPDASVGDVYGWAGSDSIATRLFTGSPVFSATISNVGASTFQLQTDAPNADTVYLLCLRGTTDPLVAKNGVLDTPTTTGTFAAVAGMGAAPKLLLTFPSRQTTIGRVSGDGGGAFGLIAAANNGGSQYGGVTVTEDDNADPTVAKCQSTDSQALRVLDIAASATVQAAVQSWDAGGVTLNYSAANVAALKVPYLALGVASGAAPSAAAAQHYYRSMLVR